MTNYLVRIELNGYKSLEKTEMLNAKMAHSGFLNEYIPQFFLGASTYGLPTCEYVICHTSLSLESITDLAYNIALSVNPPRGKPSVVVVEFSALNTKYLPISGFSENLYYDVIQFNDGHF